MPGRCLTSPEGGNRGAVWMIYGDCSERSGEIALSCGAGSLVGSVTGALVERFPLYLGCHCHGLCSHIGCNLHFGAKRSAIASLAMFQVTVLVVA